MNNNFFSERTDYFKDKKYFYDNKNYFGVETVVKQDNENNNIKCSELEEKPKKKEKKDRICVNIFKSSTVKDIESNHKDLFYSLNIFELNEEQLKETMSGIKCKLWVKVISGYKPYKKEHLAFMAFLEKLLTQSNLYEIELCYEYREDIENLWKDIKTVKRKKQNEEDFAKLGDL